jgi:UDP-N-acetylglucosamine 3-dehydrogenase
VSQPNPQVEEAALRGIIVGLGSMGANHLRVLSSLAGVEVVAAVDNDAERLERSLTAYPRVKGHLDLEQALSADEFDFACVSVPVGGLATCAAALLEAGLHTLVEKPMAPSESEAERISALATERGLVLAVGYVERFNPAVAALKEKLAAGAVGPIIQMHATRVSPFPNRHGMASVALDLASHDIDVMRFLSGSEVERVYAETGVRTDDWRDDLLSATLRFGSGFTGILDVNWVSPTKVRELTVLGEHGMFVVNYLTQDLSFYEHPTHSTEWDQLSGMRGGGEGDMIRYALKRVEPLRAQWEAFVKAVRGGETSAADGSDGLAVLTVVRAVRQSGDDHQVVIPHYRGAGEE